MHKNAYMMSSACPDSNWITAWQHAGISSFSFPRSRSPGMAESEGHTGCQVVERETRLARRTLTGV